MTITKIPTDEELQQAVIEELEWTPSINSAHIGVSADGGAVTLTGVVDTFPQRMLAEKATMRVVGVRAVAEEISVRGKWDTRSDSDVAREATEALERAIDVPADSVKTLVRDHHVTLTGNVE